MKLVIFGLTISSSWANGHATLWRGLCREFIRRGHRVVFFERDVPYYAAHRDLHHLEGGELILYPSWDFAQPAVRRHLADADVAMVTSYCPDGLDAGEAVLSSAARVRAFYDLDTPVTLSALRSGSSVPYIGPRGFAEYDLVLSYTGGRALTELQTTFGARRVAPLYGSVDPEVHRRLPENPAFRADLSYIGTYAADRQDALEALLIGPARQLPAKRFVIAGAQYPQEFPWTDNIFFVQHLAPAQHAAFYSSSRLTLNVTRAAMKAMGCCPSGRLFEAAACGTPILSDTWDGLDAFFTPGSEIFVATSTADALEALSAPREHLHEVGRRARDRVLDQHTAAHRARDLETILERAAHDATTSVA